MEADFRRDTNAHVHGAVVTHVDIPRGDMKSKGKKTNPSKASRSAKLTKTHQRAQMGK